LRSFSDVLLLLLLWPDVAEADATGTASAAAAANATTNPLCIPHHPSSVRRVEPLRPRARSWRGI
jgi:hypothetical protein